jgi:hypothetical protein
MAKYRKKPVVIDAWKLTWESVLASTPLEKQIPPEVALHPDITIHVTDKIENSQYAEIRTLEGVMVASANDFIIKGTNCST